MDFKKYVLLGILEDCNLKMSTCKSDTRQLPYLKPLWFKPQFTLFWLHVFYQTTSALLPDISVP